MPGYMSTARWGSSTERKAPRFRRLVVSWLKNLGVDQTQINEVANNLDFGKLFGLATTILSSVLSVLSDLLFIGLITLFLAFDNDRFVRNLGATEAERPRVVTALMTFAASTRTYFIVATIFGSLASPWESAQLLVLKCVRVM